MLVTERVAHLQPGLPRVELVSELDELTDGVLQSGRFSVLVLSADTLNGQPHT